MPKPLRRILKLRCVETETSVMAFVVAVQAKLAQGAARGGTRRAKLRSSPN